MPRRHLIDAVIVSLCLLSSCLAGVRMPSPVIKAVRARFPDATLGQIEREHEHGVLIYEVNLTYRGQRVEAEFASDGSIGEIESTVALEDVPASVRVELKQRVGSGRITRIEKHERHGMAKGNRFKPLDKPQVRYEVQYLRAGRRHGTTVRYHAPATMPATVHAVLKKVYDGAPVIDAQNRREGKYKLFDVVIQEHDGLRHVRVTSDGVIVEVGRAMRLDDLPDVARRTIALRGRGTRITSVQKVHRRAEVTDGKYTALTPPLDLYRARLIRRKTFADLLITPDGRVHRQSDWRSLTDDTDEDADDNDGDDDNDDDESDDD